MIGILGICLDDDTVKYCQNAATNTFGFDECSVSGLVCRESPNGGAFCEEP
jgi:hypothetical protein